MARFDINTLTPEKREHFWSRVDTTGECWVWTGATTKAGYGQMRVGKGPGTLLYAHHIAYWLTKGNVPDGEQVLHTCDNPRCVRPEHLFAGTQRDNMQDMIAKGRAVHLRGESSGRALLTSADVVEIRSRVAAGEAIGVIAPSYAVSPRQVYRIANGQSWGEPNA